MDHNAQGRRPHFHRGRRGSDRRGGERRTAPQAPEQSGRSGGDHVDVEQIMRDIRARIAQRHGIELTTPQIQELAARRLDAILDPRTISPALTEQLRRGAATPAEVPLPAIEGGYSFEDFTLYETHRGLLRFIRRLLHPILKLFVNPNPLIQALNTQAKLNKDAAAREMERERRQAEWNALHYEILNRLVTEVSRAAVDVQALSMRVDALTARVDFNDRRVRAIETTAPPPRQHQPRPAEAAMPTPAPASSEPAAAGPAAPETPAGEGGARRKRRRRRGRRSGGGMLDGGAPPPAASAAAGNGDDVDGTDTDDGGDEETADAPAGAEMAAAETPVIPEPEPTPLIAPPEPAERKEQHAPVIAQAEMPPAPAPAQPTPPPDEPRPAAPVDHPDPGPPDR